MYNFDVGPKDRSTNNLFDMLNQNSGFYWKKYIYSYMYISLLHVYIHN